MKRPDEKRPDGKTILVLGGGWGGMMAATTLRGLLAPEHRVVVVEKNPRFSLCPSHLWVMTQERDPEAVQREMSGIARPGIELVREEIIGIDPATRTVTTASRELKGDFLVIALGAQLDLTGIPGFAEGAINLFDLDGSVKLRDALAKFDGGRIAVLITRTPFRCPPSPYEAAMLIDWALRKRGVRERSKIAVYTPEKMPMAVAGPEVGAELKKMLESKGIEYFPEHKVESIDGATREMRFANGARASCDLLVGVPPHRAPQTVVDAKLTDATGYIPVHPQTMELLADVDNLVTKMPGVYAIGDVTSARLMNGMLLPKAGVFAEAQATVVAQNIAARVAGKESSAVFDGRGVCYVEVGDGMAATGSGNFYAYPAPWVQIEAPSAEGRKAKEQYESVLDAWFKR